MKRVPEPELMVDPASVAAYAAADFAEPHDRFVRLLAERLDFLPAEGRAVDVGCGPCDISVRFSSAFPGWRIDAVDGSLPMLVAASAVIAHAERSSRISLHALSIPADAPEPSGYDLVFSNSLLHHLRNPAVLWETVASWIRRGGAVFVMDLVRPATRDHARALVERYAQGESDTLRSDFYRSLLAAYEPHEVRAQIDAAGLTWLEVDAVSDRHWIAWGVHVPR